MVSYLYNRYQYVEFDNQLSSLLPITHGVPQRSVLGPTLFNTHGTDMGFNIRGNKSLQHDDDPNIY